MPRRRKGSGSVRRQGDNPTNSWQCQEWVRREWLLEATRQVQLFADSLTMGPESSLVKVWMNRLPIPGSHLEARILQGLVAEMYLTSMRTIFSAPFTFDVRAPRQSPTDRRRGVADRARTLIDAELGHPWTLTELSRRVTCNRTTMQMAFRMAFGEPVHRYVVRRRIEVAKVLLRNSDLKIEAIVGETGYKSKTAFYRAFEGSVGITPAQFRKTACNGLACR
jgi:AraC-like DNA-binding protein